MHFIAEHSDQRLRVLVAAQPGAGTTALAAWITETRGTQVTTAGGSVDTTLEVARNFGPDVVLLDFHGTPGPRASFVSQLKDLPSRPTVLVLTHDASDLLRQRCREARVDAVLEKNSDLHLLQYLLGFVRRRHGNLRTAVPGADATTPTEPRRIRSPAARLPAPTRHSCT